jgi:hypothetical protein
LRGLGVVLALTYSDDEPGSPWSFWLYLDARADRDQHDALEQIFLGRLGGTPKEQFPWIWKPSDLLGVRAVEIEIDHKPGRGWFRAAGHVSVRIRKPVSEPAEVTCVIPGHHQQGREVQAESLEVEDEPLGFEFSGRCGYESGFAYTSGDA